MKNKKVISLLMAVAMMFSTVLPVQAASTSEKISAAKEEKANTESQLQNTQEEISDLETKKGQLEAKIEELNSQLSALTDNLEELNQQAEDKKKELAQVEKDLEAAKKKEADQYESMKLRIGYMYEHSQDSYIAMLLDSESFTDFLNRANQILTISNYDRNQLKEYEATKQEVANKEESVKDEQKQITTLQKQAEDKRTEVENVVSTTYSDIQEYAAALTDSEAQANSLLAQVSSQEDTLNGLLKQAKDEEAARQLAEQQAAEAAAAQAAQEAAAAEAAQAAAEQAASTAQVEAPAADTSSEQQTTPAADTTTDTTTTDSGSSSSSTNASGGTYLGTFTLTSYCNCSICCGSWANGLTASGTTPVPGRTVAMGGVPFGTQLLINGNVYTVEDRGTAYGHVDIYAGSHSEALAFGLQSAEVYQLN